MQKNTRFAGLDVHAETISVAVAEAGREGEVRSVGKYPNRPEAVRKMVKQLGGPKGLKVCYEAGPTGYVLYWQLIALGVACEVVAPSLVPSKAGDRVKTDRRDALKLARSYRSGDLTPVWVPDRQHEALRDLVRAREAAKKDQTRARNRLGKFLLRHGYRPEPKIGSWTAPYRIWLKGLKFDDVNLEAVFTDYLHEVEHAAERVARLERQLDDAVARAPERLREVVAALQALRGVKKLTALTIVSELGEISRFERAPELMGYSGLVPSEWSTGKRRRLGSITKTGNAHLRRVLVEAAWCYRHRPHVWGALKKRQEGVAEDVKEIAWKAQHRLYKRYWHLASGGKLHPKVIVGIARELLGFVWAIGVTAERQQAERAAA